MCIIKLLIDKGVRDWPQYRRRTPPLLQTHACTQIHMMTGGAAEMKGLRRTAFIDQGYLLSVTLLNKRAVDAWGTFSQHRWHFPASAFHFIFITVHFIYRIVQLQFIDSLSFMLFPSSVKHRRCCPSCTFPCNVVVIFTAKLKKSSIIMYFWCFVWGTEWIVSHCWLISKNVTFRCIDINLIKKIIKAKQIQSKAKFKVIIIY